jgi:hypothetical protein
MPVKNRLVMGIVLAKYPSSSAGHQLSILHWLWGFEEMGWDVWVVESIKSKDCRDANGRPCCLEVSVQFANWQRFVEEHHLRGRATLFVDGGSSDKEEFRRFAYDADLFLNYAGQFDLMDEVEDVRETVYLDVDPGYTQTWASGYGCDMNLDGHDYHVTIGSAYGLEDCRIPSTGHHWISTLPPISIPFYEARGMRNAARYPSGSWTTVTHWHGAADVECGGLVLRGKRENFLTLLDLPARSPRPICVASDMERDWEDFPRFSSKGWKFRSVHAVCSSMNSYLEFISSSIGEIGVAKEGFCVARTGWLSDRSMSYLACGRPVIAQDTGWVRQIGEHAGLRAFSTEDEAFAAIQDIEGNYRDAALSALDVSSRIFGAPVVIGGLLGRLGFGARKELLQVA